MIFIMHAIFAMHVKSSSPDTQSPLKIPAGIGLNQAGNHVFLRVKRLTFLTKFILIINVFTTISAAHHYNIMNHCVYTCVAPEAPPISIF